MSISELTTEHSPTREKHFAGKLYLFILGAILMAAIFSYFISSQKSLNPQDLGVRAGTIKNNPAGIAPNPAGTPSK